MMKVCSCRAGHHNSDTWAVTWAITMTMVHGTGGVQGESTSGLNGHSSMRLCLQIIYKRPSVKHSESSSSTRPDREAGDWMGGGGVSLHANVECNNKNMTGIVWWPWEQMILCRGSSCSRQQLRTGGLWSCCSSGGAVALILSLL